MVGIRDFRDVAGVARPMNTAFVPPSPFLDPAQVVVIERAIQLSQSMGAVTVYEVATLLADMSDRFGARVETALGALEEPVRAMVVGTMRQMAASAHP